MKKILAFGFAALTIAVTAYAAFGDPAVKKPESAEAHIRATLNMTADGWNRGDLS